MRAFLFACPPVDRSHVEAPIVPTLRVGMQPGTLRVPFESWNAERPLRHSHAERGNDQAMRVIKR